MSEFDYIVVGGGSAGGALFYRLSENPRNRVLLIEAGPARRHPYHFIPAGSVKITGVDPFDWLYRAEADASTDGREVIWGGGRGLGGSSLINGMVYIRGTREDYDEWADAGCDGWGFDDLLPFFRRMESFDGPQSHYHGSDGPIGVSVPKEVHSTTKAFLEALRRQGHPILKDYSDGNLDGAFENFGTIKNGLRSSTVDYIKPAGRRPNTEIITGAHATRILFDGRRAVGVEILRNGRRQIYGARGEIIVSCGSLQSPLLLMRSGIGPGEELQAHGIEQFHSSPNVGRNLQEHLGSGTARRVNIPTYNVQAGPIGMVRHALTFALRRSGALTTAACQALAYFRSRPGLDVPDYSMSFVPIMIDYTTRPLKLSPIAGASIGAVVLKPRARGRVGLQDADPSSKPRIEFQMLSDARDVDLLMHAVREADKLWDVEPLAALVEERLGLPKDATDAQMFDYLKQSVTIAWHPVGTCRMGKDPEAVLDPRLRVNGVEGLRVADASVMPRIVSGNTNAAAMMIGERAADLILRAAS